MSCYSSDYQPCSSVPLLHTFPTTSVSVTCQLIIKSPSTTCALDPVPTWLLKHIAEDLIPFLTHLINSSITSGVVPRSMKHAFVTPHLKKANLDPDNMTNYRPIAKLCFASKLLERHDARCLLDHATTNYILDRNQSAYRPHHSTETSPVLVQNDILKALDRRHGVILLLLAYVSQISRPVDASQALVSSSWLTIPSDGGRCCGQTSKMWSTVCSGAPHSQTEESLRPHFSTGRCVDRG